MLLSTVIQSLILALSVNASPVNHLHHAHKREVVHVTETVVVTVGGNGQDIAAPAPTQAVVEPQTEGTQTAYAYQVTVAPEAADSTATAQVKNFEAQAAAPAQTQAQAQNDESNQNSAPTAHNAGSLGITYSPYNADGTCKDLNAVKSDLSKLSNYQLIRLYGVDCNQVENVLQAKSPNQKLFLGIFFVDQLDAGISQLSNAIHTYGSWNDVHTVSIGNELVNQGAKSPSQIGALVASAKSQLQAAGYSGPVVSVDTHVAIINNPELCQYSDYIAFNAHAYWDGTIVGKDSGAWLLLQMQRVWSACGGKNVMVVESGWPHAGDSNGVAVASPSEQSAAISSIQSTCGDDTIVFNAFDDLWKAPGSKNCEQFWGIY
ncbi:hypothetical protein CANINC_003707 [Pichia inconspicua]|uniref:Glycoside hydrolase family 17 protein n=1 Tax=Pichia inconspicua TaxID=52247 RepID=A0A4T0WY40_9ASCO|nr:hypothetical protein CANINC_003707 [[Candida] inconspicua]